MAGVGVRLLVLLVFFAAAARSLRFEIKSGGMKCISEDINTDAMAVGKYSVVSSDDDASHPPPDSHKISVRVTSPYGNSIHVADDVPSGNFAFTATEAGNYLACFFSSEHKPPVSVTIEFDWKTGVAAKDWTNIAKKGKIDGRRNAEFEQINYFKHGHPEWYILSRMLIGCRFAAVAFEDVL